MSHRLHIYTTVEDYGTDGKKMRLIQLCSLVEQIPTIPKILVLAAVEDPKKNAQKCCHVCVWIVFRKTTIRLDRRAK